MASRPGRPGGPDPEGSGRRDRGSRAGRPGSRPQPAEAPVPVVEAAQVAEAPAPAAAAPSAGRPGSRPRQPRHPPRSSRLRPRPPPPRRHPSAGRPGSRPPSRPRHRSRSSKRPRSPRHPPRRPRRRSAGRPGSRPRQPRHPPRSSRLRPRPPPPRRHPSAGRPGSRPPSRPRADLRSNQRHRRGRLPDRRPPGRGGGCPRDGGVPRPARGPPLRPRVRGQASLALDLAAALLCTGGERWRPTMPCVPHLPDGRARQPPGPPPTRARGTGAARSGSAARTARRGVRDLVTELALLPVEGVARVAIIGEAHRVNDDAQSALLKTLEEPLGDTTVILCADDEERLLPTIRSRCARDSPGRRRRARRGASARRAGARGRADGRPSRAPHRRPPGPGRRLRSGRGAEAVRNEITRTLLDLLDQGRHARLLAARDAPRARRIAGRAARSAGCPVARGPEARRRPREGVGIRVVRRRRRTAVDGAEAQPTRRRPTSRPRRARPPSDAGRSLLLLDAWRDVARDLALAQLDAPRSIRDIALHRGDRRGGAEPAAGCRTGMLARLVRAYELVEANVSPELVLDVLLVRWPHRRHGA